MESQAEFQKKITSAIITGIGIGALLSGAISMIMNTEKNKNIQRFSLISIVAGGILVAFSMSKKQPEKQK